MPVQNRLLPLEAAVEATNNGVPLRIIGSGA